MSETASALGAHVCMCDCACMCVCLQEEREREGEGEGGGREGGTAVNHEHRGKQSDTLPSGFISTMCQSHPEITLIVCWRPSECVHICVMLVCEKIIVKRGIFGPGRNITGSGIQRTRKIMRERKRTKHPQ